MSDDTVIDKPPPGLHAADTESRSAAGQVARLVKAITPDLRPDPRAALRDMRVRDSLRTALEDPGIAVGLTLIDETADDPYADATGKTLQRRFSVLKSASDQVVLLQIPDWIANDGANVGAMDELQYAFSNQKVRIVAQDVQTPSRSLEKKLPGLWRERAKIDVEFVSWRYVVEMIERRLAPAEAFGLGVSAVSTPSTASSEKKRIKRVFISSTGRDLEDYRKAAEEICLRMQFFPDMMEYFDAMGAGATAGSKKKLEQSDLYVGIFAHRYGYIETDAGYDKSVTEIEFDYAGERKMERLCFMLDPKHPWPQDASDPEHYKEMAAFRQRIEKLIRAQFTTCDDFRAKLTQALSTRRD